MPNLLAVPFKQSYKAPLKQAIRDYIHTSTDLHPEIFKWDINRWETLREEGKGGVAHVDRIDKMIRHVFPSHNYEINVYRTVFPVIMHSWYSFLRNYRQMLVFRTTLHL